MTANMNVNLEYKDEKRCTKRKFVKDPLFLGNHNSIMVVSHNERLSTR